MISYLSPFPPYPTDLHLSHTVIHSQTTLCRRQHAQTTPDAKDSAKTFSPFRCVLFVPDCNDLNNSSGSTRTARRAGGSTEDVLKGPVEHLLRPNSAPPELDHIFLLQTSTSTASSPRATACTKYRRPTARCPPLSCYFATIHCCAVLPQPSPMPVLHCHFS